MAFTTRLAHVRYHREHFNERTWMCSHQVPPLVRVVAHVGDAGQAKPHLEHNPLSLLGTCHAMPLRKLNDPGSYPSPLPNVSPLSAKMGRRKRSCVMSSDQNRLRRFANVVYPLYAPIVHRIFRSDLFQHWGSPPNLTWLGNPIWQDPLTLW